MDRTSVKAQLREVTERLAELDAERSVLVHLKSGYEGWLAIYGGQRQPNQPTLELVEPRRAPAGKPVGARSLRGSVTEILRDAKGKPMTTQEILTRARSLGADSAAKDPHGVVDLILYTLKKRAGAPVERVGPRTWRWIGN